MSQNWQDKPVKYLRDTVVDQLQDHLAANHLEVDEFEQRVHVALNTQSKAELMALTADLPAPVKTAITQQKQPPLSQTAPQTAPLPELYADTQTITCIMSESKRNGIWAPSKHIQALIVMGDTTIDFRDVQIRSDVTHIAINCWMGEVKIIVPPGVNVLCQVKSIMGAVKNNSRGKMDSSAPTIVIQGRVVMGEVKISVR